MKKQKRFVFISIALVLILAFSLAGCGGGKAQSGGSASSTSGGGSSNEVINWSFYCAYGPEDGACCVIWPQLFKEIEEKTNGRLVITTYWEGQHPYAEDDMLKVIEDGSAELAFFYSGYVSSVEPIFSADALPLMLPADSMQAWKVMSGLWGNFSGDKSGYLEGLLQDRWNASMVHMVPASPQRFFTAGFPVTDMDSLKGHKIRTYSSDLAKLVEIMGGTPVPISFSEVYTSLATNLIDGLITSTAFAESGGFFDYTDNVGVWEIAQGTDGMMVDLDALAALPADIRDVFQTVMRTSAQKPEMMELDDTDELVSRLKADGVVFTVPGGAERDQLRAACKDKIWDAWLAQVGDEGQKLLDEIDRLNK